MKQFEIRITASNSTVMASIGAVTIKLDFNEVENNLDLIKSLLAIGQKKLGLKFGVLEDMDRVEDYVKYIRLWLTKDFVCDATCIIYEDGKIFFELNGKNTIDVYAIIVMLSQLSNSKMSCKLI